MFWARGTYTPNLVGDGSEFYELTGGRRQAMTVTAA
jgi:hypothetical protein